MARFINGVTDYKEWRKEKEDNEKMKARMAVINEMKTKDTLTLADEIRLVMVIMITTLTGKLKDFYSISTSVLMNNICQARAKNPDSICHDCYAASGASRYSGLAQALESNFIILNTWLLSEQALATLALPTTNGFFRIESHGDVASLTCARNYVRIIKTHPWIRFGVWTKNFGYWVRAFELEGGKPENMSFIVSSDKKDKKVNLPENVLKYTDHVFTVYRPETIEKENIKINCGAKNCNDCVKAGVRCYHKDGTFEINEKLK